MTLTVSRIWRKQYALPAEHGAWALWLGPLAVGLGTAGSFGAAHLWLIGAMLLLFLARQPLLILVKVLAGRRGRDDLAPAAVWLGAYAAGAALFSLPLGAGGYLDLALLLLISLPVLVWQMALVAQRVDRQIAIELAGTGALALAAPAAYRVGASAFDSTAAWLWLLCWFQSAAAISYVYLRLAQRRLDHVPDVRERWQMARRPLVYHTFNTLAAILLSAHGVVPPLAPVAFGVMLVQCLWGAARAGVGVRPQSIGFAQVGATAVFALSLIAAYRL